MSNPSLPTEVCSLPVRVSKLSESELADCFLIRAAAFRGLVVALVRAGLLKTVFEQVPLATQRLLKKPPLPWAFMPALPIQHVMWAVERTVDRMAVRKIGRDAILYGPLKFFHPIVRVAMRASKANPHDLLEAFCRAVESNTRGLEMSYRRLGQNEGELHVIYSHLESASVVAFAFWEGAALLAFQLANVTGTVGAALVETTEAGVAGRTRIAWRA